MKKIINITLALTIILLTFPSASIGQEKYDVSNYLNKTILTMVEQKQVKGAIISVISNGSTELVKGYGYADEKNGVKANKDNTAFRIGSLSKTFVAVAALHLAQEGKLDMDASISKYLDSNFPKLKYDISMNDLLTHSAGFEDMLSGIAIDNISKLEPLDISIIKYMPVQVFHPGEVVSYSNYGIALAAYVIQCITDTDFDTYAEVNIFKPLEMTKTSFKLDFSGVEVSKGYSTNGNETQELLINLYPEGSVVSTAVDMAKYMQWLMDDNEKILTQRSKQSLFKQHFTMSAEFEGMGYVWKRNVRNGEYYYDKKGETQNFYSRIVLYPNQKSAVFLTFNTYVKEEQLNEIMNEVTGLILGYEETTDLYNGEQTTDISGDYITTRSSFENIEKVINFLTPNQVIHIKGNPTDGFKLNGESLIPIGENYYSSGIGNLKYIERASNSYLANNTAISYVQTKWYERNIIQMIIFGSFAITSFIMMVMSMIDLFTKKRLDDNNLLVSLSIINFGLFIAICLLIYIGLSNFILVNIDHTIRILGMFIVATSVIGIMYTMDIFINKKFKPRNILLIIWNISSILFCLWMNLVNIL